VIGLLFELLEWMVKLTVIAVVLLVRMIAAGYRAADRAVHGYRLSKNPDADRETSQLMAGGLVASVIGVLVLIGSLSGGSGSDSSTSGDSSAKADVGAFAAVSHKAKPHHSKAVHIRRPGEGHKFNGDPYGSAGTRQVALVVRGTGEPGKHVRVSADGHGPGRSARVQVNYSGTWRAKIKIYGCGPDDYGTGIVDLEATYKKNGFDYDSREVEIRCPPPATQATTAPVVPAGTTCSETPMRNFPVPPGDPRDRDGDGIACET
jgi:hypothetical protein